MPSCCRLNQAEAIGLATFIPNGGLDGRDIGGGAIQTIGFGCQEISGDGEDLVNTTINQRFSLSDISGLSSCAFAEIVESYVPFLDKLLPAYYYTPVKNALKPENAPTKYYFADGGNLENTGITALLRRESVDTVVSFVNCSVDIKNDDGFISVDSQLPPLFGLIPPSSKDKEKTYRRYADGDIPKGSEPFSGNQVFSESAFYDLLQGLWQAKESGGPVIFVQKNLSTLGNEKFAVPAGKQVDVVWVYNSLPEKWWDSLSTILRAEVKLDLLSFRNFPHYNTITELELNAEQVNLLSHMMTWNIIQDEHIIPSAGMTSKALFESIYE